jgi:hypothetical protein
MVKRAAALGVFGGGRTRSFLAVPQRGASKGTLALAGVSQKNAYH